ncbi:MAG: hypothetical protein AAFR50_10180 [Pseudomonadota bacterium]
MIGARIKAATIEGALAAAVCCPAYFLAEQAGLGRAISAAIWLSVTCGLAPLILAIRALTQKTPAPEHRRAGLTLRGRGCHVCRWIRFWWPLGAAPLAAAAGLATGSWGIYALGLAVATIHLATALSALAEEKEPHWARATGFHFERRNT